MYKSKVLRKIKNTFLRCCSGHFVLIYNVFIVEARRVSGSARFCIARTLPRMVYSARGQKPLQNFNIGPAFF